MGTKYLPPKHNNVRQSPDRFKHNPRHTSPHINAPSLTRRPCPPGAPRLTRRRGRRSGRKCQSFRKSCPRPSVARGISGRPPDKVTGIEGVFCVFVWWESSLILSWDMRPFPPLLHPPTTPTPTPTTKLTRLFFHFLFLLMFCADLSPTFPHSIHSPSPSTLCTFISHT